MYATATLMTGNVSRTSSSAQVGQHHAVPPHTGRLPRHTRQVPGRVVVYRCRVLEHHEVEPTASPFPAGRDAPFAADFLQFLAHLASVLGFEDTLSNSRLVAVSGFGSRGGGGGGMKYRRHVPCRPWRHWETVSKDPRGLTTDETKRTHPMISLETSSVSIVIPVTQRFSSG